MAYPAEDNDVMVLHTLVVDPDAGGHGYGTLFVEFYESYAVEHSCHYLRMDTNEKNRAARSLLPGGLLRSDLDQSRGGKSHRRCTERVGERHGEKDDRPVD